MNDWPQQSSWLQAHNRYEVLVEAFTLSTPELVGSLMLVIVPMDTNDNPPSFTSDLYEVAVTEDVPVGSNILQVRRLAARITFLLMLFVVIVIMLPFVLLNPSLPDSNLI